MYPGQESDEALRPQCRRSRQLFRLMLLLSAGAGFSLLSGLVGIFVFCVAGATGTLIAWFFTGPYPNPFDPD